MLVIPGNGFQIIFLFFVLALVTSIQKQPWVVVLQSGESGPYHTGVGATISASHAMCIQIAWAFKKCRFCTSVSLGRRLRVGISNKLSSEGSAVGPQASKVVSTGNVPGPVPGTSANIVSLNPYYNLLGVVESFPSTDDHTGAHRAAEKYCC